ncbi:hypothetical protein MAR_029261 [Mya arenaria]|uniref:Secreted protein n=1 Tax=Mya arenaria TaxID=6604 RepID=A0ABY7DFW5_MYAAR|nr:hypothetical protein MAR_029261 [Mya arenaria]
MNKNNTISNMIIVNHFAVAIIFMYGHCNGNKYLFHRIKYKNKHINNRQKVPVISKMIQQTKSKHTRIKKVVK